MFTKIPKVAYFYWGKTPMPFLNAATIFSFKKYHPDWEMVLYSPKEQSQGQNPSLFERPFSDKDYADLAFTMINDRRVWDCEEIGMTNDINDIQKADLLRHYVLWKYGGMWVDMDVLFLKSVEKSTIPSDTDVALSYCGWFSSGIVLASPLTSTYEYIHKESLVRLNQYDYQSVGPNLLNNLFGDMKKLYAMYPELKIYNMPMEMFYPYRWDNIEPFYEKGFEYITDKTVGIHWFGGNMKSKSVVRTLTPSTVKKFKGTVVGEIIKEFI